MENTKFFFGVKFPRAIIFHICKKQDPWFGQVKELQGIQLAKSPQIHSDCGSIYEHLGSSAEQMQVD